MRGGRRNRVTQRERERERELEMEIEKGIVRVWVCVLVQCV